MAVNILLSFAYHAKADLHRVKAALCNQGLLMIDSGAFTAYTLGKTISLTDYAAYLHNWAGAWDTAVTLDVIGDHKATARNTRKLHDMGLPVLPVYTFGTKMAELDAMAKDHPYICVGGTVGYTKQRQLLPAYLATVRRRAAEHGCSIHTLGVGSLQVITAVRPYTADSSAASIAPSYGSVLVWNGRRLHSINKTDATRHAEILRRHGIHPAIVAAGRAWEKDRRKSTCAVGFYAVSLADEYLKRLYTNPTPPGLTRGPHLFSAATHNKTEIPAVELAARQAASGVNPPAWADTPRDGPHLYSASGCSWITDAAIQAATKVAGDRKMAGVREKGNL